MYLKILSPTLHNGERLNPGDIVEMDNKQAAILIADGIAEKTAKPVPVKEPAKPGKTEKAAADSSGSPSTSNDKEPADEDNAEDDESGKNDSTGAE
jgi:hypothetical protein